MSPELESMSARGPRLRAGRGNSEVIRPRSWLLGDVTRSVPRNASGLQPIAHHKPTCTKTYRYLSGRTVGDNFRVADNTPGTIPGQYATVGWILLTNADLSSHAIDQLLGIVADPGLKHSLHILDVLNSL